MVLPQGIEFKVCWLLHKDGTSPALDYLLSLTQVDKDFFGTAKDVLTKLGDSQYHVMPWTRPLKGGDAKGILEARAMGGKRRQYARFPFFYTKNREVILLFGFTKDDGDAPPNFVQRAKLYKELIEEGKLGYEESDLQHYQ